LWAKHCRREISIGWQLTSAHMTSYGSGLCSWKVFLFILVHIYFSRWSPFHDLCYFYATVKL